MKAQNAFPPDKNRSLFPSIFRRDLSRMGAVGTETIFSMRSQPLSSLVTEAASDIRICAHFRMPLSVQVNRCPEHPFLIRKTDVSFLVQFTRLLRDFSEVMGAMCPTFVSSRTPEFHSVLPRGDPAWPLHLLQGDSSGPGWKPASFAPHTLPSTGHCERANTPTPPSAPNEPSSPASFKPPLMICVRNIYVCLM